MVEPLGNHRAMLGVEDPLLANCMTDAERRSTENLSTERPWVDYCAHIGVCQKIHKVVLAGFDIHFDFSEACNVGMRHAIARVVVAGGRDQALSYQCGYGRFGHLVDI